MFGDCDHETCLVSIMSRHDFDVISWLEAFAQAASWDIDSLPVNIHTLRTQGYDVVRNGLDDTMHTRLLSFEDFDVVPGLQDSNCFLLRRFSDD